MKLYLLEVDDDGVDYDGLRAIVVRASSESEARCMAREADHKAMAPVDWMTATCTVVEVEGKPEIICADYAEA